MSRVKIENDQLIITMEGIRKYFASKGEISIPLCNLDEVTTGILWKELPNRLDKIVGANANSIYLGGTFIHEDGVVFYDLRRKEDAVVISLKDSENDPVTVHKKEIIRLVIGVDNPEETVEYIKKSLKRN